MQPFSTSADKTLTGLRPDTADKDRAAARAAGSGPDGAPFGAVFHASSERPARSGPFERASVQTAKTADDTGAERPDGPGDNPELGRAVDDTPQDPRAQATGPAPGEHAEHEAGEKATRPSTETLPVEPPRSDITDPDAPMTAMTAPNRAGPTGITAAEGSASGLDIDNVSENGVVAASLENAGKRTPHVTSASEAAPRVRGAAPDRQPPAPPAQPLAGPAPAASDRATDTTQAATLGFASDIGGPRTGSRGTEAAGWRLPMIRGQDDARPSPPTGAPVLAQVASPPVMQGSGEHAMHAKTALSSAQFATFADRTGGEGADRGADADAPLGVEARGTSGTGTSSPTLAMLPRSDLPQAIAMQIAAAIQKGGPGMKPGIELMLSPEELGPVRLTFTQSETGVTVNVHADRAETLELLRRNIDSLAQEFLDIGYDSAEFTFERRDAEARDAARTADMDDADSAAGVTRDAPDAVTPILLVSDRLDIRL